MLVMIGIWDNMDLNTWPHKSVVGNGTVPMLLLLRLSGSGPAIAVAFWLAESPESQVFNWWIQK